MLNATIEIEVCLDVRRATLTFRSGTEHLATITGLNGREFFPCVWFYKKAFYPVEIRYREGPSGERQCSIVYSKSVLFIVVVVVKTVRSVCVSVRNDHLGRDG